MRKLDLLLVFMTVLLLGSTVGHTGSYVTPGLDSNLSQTSHTKPDGTPRATPAVTFYHGDGLGSIRGLTDASGTLTNTYDYTAFGESFAPNTWAKPDPNAGTGGIPANAKLLDNRYTYTGRALSPLAAQGAPMYYRYRTYTPGIGRFSRRDPAGYPNNPMGNLYEYAYGDPFNYNDPMGLGVGHHKVPQSLFKNAIDAVQKVFNEAASRIHADGYTLEEKVTEEKVTGAHYLFIMIDTM